VPASPARRVTLVLCTRDGVLLGALPPYEVPVPYWQEAGPVVDGAAERHHVGVTVLRLLSASAPEPGDGGDVSYLAQVNAAPPPGLPLTAWPGDPLADEPLRQTWARPGGPDADLAWADGALEDRGTPRAGPARQVRTWNLSSLWRLPLPPGRGGRPEAAWLKVVPPFLAHESRVLTLLDAAAVPPVLATDGPRVLLGEVAGEDQYDAPPPVRLRMVELLVGLQATWAHRVEELVGLGVPDWRGAALAERAAGTLGRQAGALGGGDRGALETLVAGLGDRFAAVAACGVPDSLLHGDFHPGNVCARPDGSLTLLDWGDCGIGHPLLDQPAMLARLGAEDRRAVGDVWAALWRAAVPGSEPERAAALLEPVAALRLAVVYDRFLARIEPDERVYHRADPGTWLRRAAALTGS